MTVARTTLLDLPIITTGTESGLWGDYTNNGLTQYLDISIAGMSNLTSANFTAGALTIETTEGTNSATNIVATSAQYAGFRVSSLAVNSTITVGNTGTTLGRSYRLINADSTYTLTFKATGQTGVTLQPGQSATVAFNGTDYVFVGVVLNAAQTFTAAQTFRAANAIRSEAASTQDAVVVAGRAGGTSSYAVTITPTTLSASRTVTLPNADINFTTGLGVGNGGTGTTTLTANNVILGNGTSAVQFVAPGTNGNVLTSNGTTWTSAAFSAITIGTPVATTSGTSIDFTGIPSGVKQITVMFSGVSINATSTSAIIQLGDSGGIETTDYYGAYERSGGGISTQFTSGFIVFDSTNTAFTYEGLLVLNLLDSSTNTWVGAASLAMSQATQTVQSAGRKALSGVLDRIRLTTLSGTAVFDAGQINIAYI